MARRILIIGGGVIGVSVAFHLAEAKAGEVVLLERDRIGSGTTWHSAGNITWKPSHFHDQPVLQMLETVERLHTLPFGWDENAEVYGDHEGDLTVEQCVAAGEAPEYSKHLASFTARKAVQS